ncbi:MAG TPA: hypothetical protein VFV75_10550 [Candidatus Polarisedimenticolaceae bacterium]|nr:hypothetical protein [Candidatus Polarisedimenticolaceae bacterium]
MVSSLLCALTLAGTPVMERLVPLEVQTGVVRLRTVEAPLLEVPEVQKIRDVQNWELGDWSEQRFSRLYRMEFFLETRSADGEVTLEERGALLVAPRLEEQDLQALDDTFRDRLHALGTDSFSTTLAGFLQSPWPMERLLHRSTAPSWSCVRGKGFGDQGRAEAFTGGGSRGMDFSGRVCATFWRASEGSAVEEIRALSSPRRARDAALRLEATEPIPKEVPAAELAPLPSGTTFTRGVSAREGCGGTVTVLSHGLYHCEGIEWKAETRSAAISPEVLTRHALVSRWTFEEVERTFGADPRRDIRIQEALLMAFVPVAHSFDALAPEQRIAVPFDLASFRTELVRRLTMQPTLSLEALEKVLTDHGVRELADLLLVVCRPDGTAWFGLPPTLAQNTLTNAAVFCAAMERMLP